MIIEIRRHGDWDRKTGGLTPESKRQAVELSKFYTKVFSAEPNRCIETARAFNESKVDVVIRKEFNDLVRGENIGERIGQMLGIICSEVEGNLNEQRILIVTHNNLIGAIQCFKEGKPIPQNFDQLPLIENLKGVDIIFLVL